MKKKLNIDTIQNELSEGSVFFSRQKAQSPPPPDDTTRQPQTAANQPPPTAPEEPEKPPTPQPFERRNVRTNERTFERRKIRHTFDIYADQLLSLREIAIEREKLFSERVLLGDLVQEALDAFITKERNKE